MIHPGTGPEPKQEHAEVPRQEHFPQGRHPAPWWKKFLVTVTAVILGLILTIGITKAIASFGEWEPVIRIKVEHSGYIREVQ